MPSVGTAIAQNVTRTFTVTQAPGAGEGSAETGAHYFLQSTIDAWYADNASDMTKVSRDFYIITGSFASTIGNLDDDGTFDIRRSLIDMGKEIVIGNPIQSRLLVLRKVKESDSPANGGDGMTAYVVVESNYRSANWPTPDNSKFNVAVARV
jgi:hypothetical protein